MSEFVQGFKSQVKTKISEKKGDDQSLMIDFQGLLDVIAQVLKDGKFDMEDFEPIVVYTEELFDELVVPYDIPGIGPIFERAIESIVRRLIRPGIKLLFDQFVDGGSPGEVVI